MTRSGFFKAALASMSALFTGVSGRLQARGVRASDKEEQLEVQLAGCLCAAEGWGLQKLPVKGDWAWSPAFQAVLDLRRKHDALLHWAHDSANAGKFQTFTDSSEERQHKERTF